MMRCLNVFKKTRLRFSLAAHFANQNSVDNPELDLMVNGMGILKVLEYAHLVGVERFVYSSSGCGVYGLDSKMPFEERTSHKPPHTLSGTKLIGELYTNYFTIFTTYPLSMHDSSMYLPGEVPGKYRNVIPNFMYWSMTNQHYP
jgi:nucleoside-diphosphate-sugar epimerase